MGTDPLFDLKDTIRTRFPKLYSLIVSLISPVYFNGIPKEFLTKINWGESKVLDLGSGVIRRHKNITNVDMFPYPGVDIVCDLHQIPLGDNSVDYIISIATLEHVKHPQKVVEEIYRILKPSGEVCCYIPFIQGVHAAPNDFTRYTPDGLATLFARFSDRKVCIGAGPASGFAWVLHEWLALFFSFGSARLYRILYFLFFLVTPIKFFDIFMRHHPEAAKISSGFTITAIKRTNES